MGSFDAVQSQPLIDSSAYSVRDGRLAPVTCVVCGCRLERREGSDSWWHFAGAEGRDARGCIVACATAPHYSSGTQLSGERVSAA